MEDVKEHVPDLMSTLDLPPEFKTGEPLLLSEVAYLMAVKQTQSEVVDYGGRGIFDQTNDYCKKFHYFKTQESLGAVRNSLVNAGLDSAEVALVGTVVPRDSDEALTLFPSLQSKDIANIDIALNEINNQKDALG
eukprot:TRINITY_DN2381_c0_g1_i1.p1 TRINITY_DN2381_c0_g1~~TRINITY_DN2381_c0_g1_i1.p1  ORF type:complete len:135 (+),score=33.37 TRINITY_DN2381_c0_g1_i1:22-426(+)